MNKHTDKFYNKAFDKYQKEIIARGEVPIIKSPNHFRHVYDMFKKTTKGSVINKIVNQEVYELGYQPARTFVSKLKKQGIYTTVQEIRKMPYEERKKRYGEAISNFYKEQLKIEGRRQAALATSTYWFGSK